jgi:2-amino-4-hydroxy-6-hydroxymethyldihydropteridine diphosphokinase
VHTQDHFLNAVARVETSDKPEDIQRHLRSIEEKLKKAPPFRFGPRTIDLDLLLYDDQIAHAPDLTLPHPRMHERRFVLEPLSELLNPRSRHPVLGKTWEELLRKTIDQECTPTNITL